MAVPKQINVGLMGLGVVGGGVAEALLKRSDAICKKAGRPIELKKVLVRDPAKHADSGLPPGVLTTDPEDLLADGDIHLVVELMGGTDPAASHLERAISSGKQVVTANKEVMAKYGPALVSLAKHKGVILLYEASVGGGIPIVGCMMNELAANQIHSIRSIINGTTNYILTRMANHHTDFQQALSEAQEMGYAEADPTNDVEGIDAVYKLAILVSLAFRQNLRPEDVYRQGISALKPQDFRYAQELGYSIKSLAIATLDDGALQARVYPALVPLENMLAKVDGVFNAVEVEGDLCGKVLFHGMGAGRGPTTSAVLGDVIEAVRRMGYQPEILEEEQASSSSGVAPEDWQVKTIDDLISKYYLRLNVADQPGVFAQIGRILGDHQISIASVLQKDANLAEQTAEIVIITHPSREAAVQASLKTMADLEVVRKVENLLRIEE